MALPVDIGDNGAVLVKKSRSAWMRFLSPVVVLATWAIAGAIGFFPLTGTPGPQSAQILSALFSPLIMLAAAERGARRSDGGFLSDIGWMAVVGGAAIGGFLVVATVTGSWHSSCAPDRGYVAYLSLAAPVAVLSAGLGLWVGRLAGNAKVALPLIVVIQLGYLAYQLVAWTVEPSFRLLTHLSVAIEADLLRPRAPSAALMAFRAATALLALTVMAAGVARFPRLKRGGLSASPSASPGAMLLAVLAFLLGCFIHVRSTSSLAPPRAELVDQYALKLQEGPLIIRADPDVFKQATVERVLGEGTLWIEKLKRRMKLDDLAEVTVFLHADRKAQRAFTGAESVHFALPSRREIHITMTRVPHPTLAHELAHVLAGDYTDAFFGVPSRFFMPLPGLAEGTAVALTAELEARHGLTLEQQAAALVQAERAPPLLELVGDRSAWAFSQNPMAASYTLAGAVVEAFIAERGVDGLKAAYAAGDLTAGFGSGRELRAFVERFEKRLATMTLPPSAAAIVDQRFSRQPVLLATCNEADNALRRQTRRLARSADLGGALKKLAELSKETTSDDVVELIDLAGASASTEEQLAALRRAASSIGEGDTASLNEIADRMWKLSERREAEALWKRARLDDLTPAERRTFVVKRGLAEAALARGAVPSLAAAALDYLTEPYAAAQAEAAGTMILRRQSDSQAGEAERFLVDYLIARRRLIFDDSTGALSTLLRMREVERPPPPELAQEMLWMFVVAHAKRGDIDLAFVGVGKLLDDAPAGAIAHRLIVAQAYLEFAKTNERLGPLLAKAMAW